MSKCYSCVCVDEKDEIILKAVRLRGFSFLTSTDPHRWISTQQQLWTGWVICWQYFMYLVYVKLQIFTVCYSCRYAQSNSVCRHIQYLVTSELCENTLFSVFAAFLLKKTPKGFIWRQRPLLAKYGNYISVDSLKCQHQCEEHLFDGMANNNNNNKRS